MDKNIQAIRAEFPLLKKRINNQKLVYFDNAATSVMPSYVLDQVKFFIENNLANVHRGIHTIGYSATQAYENVRTKVQQFINAASNQEIIFTSGCTDSLNLVAETYGKNVLHLGDEIVVSIMEHHSNFLPWWRLAQEKGASLKFIELNENEELDLNDVVNKITAKTKIVALTQVSNVLGNINPVKKIIEIAHQKGAVVVVDGAQAVGHLSVDVSNLDADFYAFSGHKMFAPTGVGVLYGKKKLLDQMPPYRLGGEMIEKVSRNSVSWATGVQKFEAGTPNIEGVIGLGAAIDFINNLGITRIQEAEFKLRKYLFNELTTIPEIKIYGSKNLQQKVNVFSFNLADIHPHDLATALDLAGIEVRAGHHCAQPLMDTLKVESTVRVSLAIFNTKEEIDYFIDTLKEIKDFFQNGLR